MSKSALAFRSLLVWSLAVFAAATLLVAAPHGLGQEPRESTRPPWEGAWHWLHETQDGRLIRTENWFCGVFGAKDRPPPRGEQPTQAEAAALFRSMPGPMCGPVNVLSATERESVHESLSELSAHPVNRGRRTRWHTRVEGDKMYSDVVRGDGTIRNTWSYQRLSDPGDSSLAGAWELVSDEWDGLMLMTDTEYRYVMTRKDRAPIQARPNELTDREAAILYHSFEAQGGAYSVRASMITRRPAISKDPREQGREMTTEFSIDGETLTIGTADQQLLWQRID